MADIAIIGGHGITAAGLLEDVSLLEAETPFGPPSGLLERGRAPSGEVIFLSRHGRGNKVPPHRINYRANVHALKQLGVKRVIATAAVGGITPAMAPGAIAIPDQIIDYTYGRDHTFFDGDHADAHYVDMTGPFDTPLRALLLDAAAAAGVAVVDGGCYAASQGPRLETAAEIARMERDGCDLVGMTAMPEAALAREAGLAYAQVAVVANWGAGKSDEEITLALVEATLSAGFERVAALLHAALGRR